jgi:hypothetical protein
MSNSIEGVPLTRISLVFFDRHLGSDCKGSDLLLKQMYGYKINSRFNFVHAICRLALDPDYRQSSCYCSSLPQRVYASSCCF